ncbi:Maf family protein [Candidatus Dependentiae bacterium]|nr:Maf family protein [Candidatus Dependentiae bacterium]
MKHVLLLASQSATRKELLSKIEFPFTVIKQDANEHSIDWSLPLEQLVTLIAALKMDSVEMPQLPEGSIAFVLTADTLCQDQAGVNHGKPDDYQDAVAKIKALRKGSMVSTGFCIEKRELKAGIWYTVERKISVVTAECMFVVPDNWIERYIAHSPALEVAGAIAIEGYGLQFLHSLAGSYTAILGLPLYEVRDALEELGFFAPELSA